VKETTMADHTRWEEIKQRRSAPAPEHRAAVERDLALGQVIYDLRSASRLSQAELAKRVGTTTSAISRLEEGGGARNRIDTLARVAAALDRHLVVSFPETVPDILDDAVVITDQAARATDRSASRSTDPGPEND
jgi:transcriptional regulator with XRE-family HTH domain